MDVERLSRMSPIKVGAKLVSALNDYQYSLCVAESCTSGLLGALLTEKAGASSFFVGGFLVYSNEVKTDLLDVKPRLLKKYGAVSEQVAAAMLIGAIKKTKADLGIAITGVAGPDGGTDEKPVGTVCFAWGSQNNFETKRLQISGSRSGVRHNAAIAGMMGLTEFLNNS